MIAPKNASQMEALRNAAGVAVAEMMGKAAPSVPGGVERLASAKQVDANRANAQKSTGPRTGYTGTA